MTELPPIDPRLEARLGRVLRAYGSSAVRPIDALVVADLSMTIERRRSARRLRILLVAAAVAGSVVLAAVAALAGGSRGLPLRWLFRPAPTPFVSPSIPEPGTVSAALSGRWIGPPRDIPGHGSSASTALVIGPAGLCVDGRSYPQGCALLHSTISVPVDGRLDLTAAAAADCDPAGVGQYRWLLTPGGTRLTLLPEADPCHARVAAVTGEWFRVGCRNPADDCLGLLEAGTYPSQFVAPRLAFGAPWSPDYEAVSYTVPDGWANSADWPVLLSLTPAADYLSEDPEGPKPGHYAELDLFAHPLAALRDGRCSGASDPAIEGTTAAFIDWLREQPDLIVSPTVRRNVGGWPAHQVDVRLVPVPAWSCPGGTAPSQDYLVLGDDLDPGHGFTPRLTGEERHRLFLVDLGDGAVVAILIDSSDPARFDALLEASMPIVDSLAIR